MSIVLCLDQSSRTSGYSVWQTHPRKLLAHGTFSYTDGDLGVRLEKIRQRVTKLITDYKIDRLYLEDIQLQGNITTGVTTYKILAEVIGVLRELAVELHIPCELVHSQSWKSTCGIKGRDRATQKKNAQLHVQNLYGVSVSEDEADSICIGEHITSLLDCAWTN